MDRTSTKSRGKTSEPYRRNITTGTDLVSNQLHSSIRKIISPKLSTSFFDQRSRGALNKRLILSRWCRSVFLLTFSVPFFLTCLPVGSGVAPCPVLGVPGDCRSAGCWFTAASSASSMSATTRFDRDQLPMSDQATRKNTYVLRERPPSYHSHPIHPQPGLGLAPSGGLPLVGLLGNPPHPGSVFPLRPWCSGGAVARLTN